MLEWGGWVVWYLVCLPCPQLGYLVLGMLTLSSPLTLPLAPNPSPFPCRCPKCSRTGGLHASGGGDGGGGGGGGWGGALNIEALWGGGETRIGDLLYHLMRGRKDHMTRVKVSKEQHRRRALQQGVRTSA